MSTTVRQTAIVARPVVNAVAERPAAQVSSVRSVVALNSSNTGLPPRHLLTIEDGQTVFQLASIPSAPQSTGLYLNGVKAIYGTEYIINAAILTWSGVALSSNDTLEILF